MQTDVTAALDECAKRLGAANVIRDAASLDRYAENVSGLARRVVAVLRPSSTADVQAIVKIANAYCLPLYPISRGRNWGMGSKLPVTDDCAVVDLSRMSEIREINAAFHYAVVEPGVTQGQLHDALRERNAPMILNVTGSSRDSSVLGNSLDRGVGYFSARAGQLSGLEVVLGNGEILRTGFGHWDGAKTSHLYKYGVGPSMDGLFCQSNFGIVTSAGVDLIPWRDEHASAIIKIKRADELGRVVDLLADLRRRDIVRMIVHLGNRARSIGTLAPLVYKMLPDDVKRDPPRARREAERMLEKEGFGPWSAVVGIGGTPAQVKAAQAEIKKSFAGLACCSFLSSTGLRRVRRFLSTLSFIPAARRKRVILDAMTPLLGFAGGVPSDAALPSVYWAAGEVPPDHGPLDPDHGVCGLLYALPILPLDGGSATACVDISERVCAKHGFPPLITLNLLDERAIEAVVTLPFRRDREESVKSAHACLRELQEEYIRNGWPPYRVGIHEMDLVLREDDVFWKTARELKKVFDPNNIIAPGRYNLV